LPVTMVLVAMGAMHLRKKWLLLTVGIAVTLNMVSFLFIPLLIRIF